MTKITPDILKNAIAKAQSRKGHAHVRHVGDDMFEVTCENPNCANNNKHSVSFELIDGELYAECFECPSNIRNAACYHLIQALTLRDAMITARVEATRAAARSHRVATHPADAAILMRLENGKRKETVRGIRI
jgi:hypothetical protein